MDRSALLASLIGAGGLLYVVSPVDLISEVVAGPLGFGDDAAVLVGSVIAIVRILRNRAVRQRATRV